MLQRRVAVVGAHLERLRLDGIQTTAAVERDLLNHLPVEHGALPQALTTLATAVVAIRRRLPEITAPPWALINVITRGWLLAPNPSVPARAIRFGAAHRGLLLPPRLAVPTTPSGATGIPTAHEKHPAPPSRTSTTPSTWSQPCLTPSRAAPPTAPGTPHTTRWA